MPLGLLGGNSNHRHPLYRHFPSRESLIEAVYRTKVERLAAAKKIIAPVLNILLGGAAELSKSSLTQIWEAI